MLIATDVQIDLRKRHELRTFGRLKDMRHFQRLPEFCRNAPDVYTILRA
jgi:hypothetical protein